MKKTSRVAKVFTRAAGGAIGLALALGACAQPPVSEDVLAGGREPAETQSLAPALCGDVQHIYVVAHQDDDLLFMNPDLSTSIKLNHCVATVFLTTSENRPGIDWFNTVFPNRALSYTAYGRSREAGIRAAYAQMSGVANDWRESKYWAAGKAISMFTLKGNARVSLFFLRLTDDADFAKSNTLVDLWYQPGLRLTALDNSNTFTKNELIASLAALMWKSEAKYVHIQDSNPDSYITDEDGNSRDDHTDHIIGAMFAQEARKFYFAPHMLVRYRDYNSILEANPNLSEAQAADKLSVFNTYAALDPLICENGDRCVTPASDGDVYKDFVGWTRRQYYNIDDDQQGSVVRDASGTSRLFVLGDRSSTLRAIGQTSANGGAWTPWADLGGNFSATPVVSAYADGRLAAFVRSNNGTLLYSREIAKGGAWTPWQDIGGQGASDAAVAVNERGQLQVFAISTGNRIMSRVDTNGAGNWNAWRDIGEKFNDFLAWSNPAVGTVRNGRLALFVRDAFGRVRVATQNPAATNWSSWANLGGSFNSDPVAGRTSDGFGAVFIRGLDGGLYWSRETTKGWTSWARLGSVTFNGSPVVTTGAGGTLAVFVRDTDGGVRSISQNANGTWGSWSYLLGGFSSVLGASRTNDGRLQVFARGGFDGLVYYRAQTGVNGDWTPWVNLGR